LIARLLEGTSVFVLPSLIENSPNSVAEAMCAGLPVVATNVGGIPSMVDDGVTGILVPPRDVGALSSAVIRLLEDRPLRQKIGAAAKERGRRLHAPGVVAQQSVETYREILELEQQRRCA
jgi:glycosyltransferase involved in cell wall biosynthesis